MEREESGSGSKGTVPSLVINVPPLFDKISSIYRPGELRRLYRFRVHRGFRCFMEERMGERDTYRHTYVEIVAINRDSTLPVDPTCTSIHLRNPSFSSIPGSETPKSQVSARYLFATRLEVDRSPRLSDKTQPLFYSTR